MAGGEGRGAGGRVALALAALMLSALLLEGGARLVLAVSGEGGAPLDVGWRAGRGDGDRVRDLLYVPDPELFFRLAPELSIGQTSNPRIFDLRTDARGYRGAPVAVPKPPGTWRVLAVGDSCTFGSGAGQDDTYPAQLAAQLAASGGPPRVEVVNAGVPGFTSYQALRLLETEGFALEPDAVILISAINDASPATAGPKRSFGAGRMLSDREYGDALRGGSRLALTRLLWRAGLWGGGARVDGVKRRVSPGEYEDNLRRFVDLARAHGSRPVLAAWPLRSQVGSLSGERDERDEPGDGGDGEVERTLARYHEVARRVARDTDAAFVDLAPALRGRPDLFVDAVHLGPEGYARVAAALAPVAAARPQAGIPAGNADGAGRRAGKFSERKGFQPARIFSPPAEKIPSPAQEARPLPPYRQQHPLPKRAGPFPLEAARSLFGPPIAGRAA